MKDIIVTRQTDEIDLLREIRLKGVIECTKFLFIRTVDIRIFPFRVVESDQTLPTETGISRSHKCKRCCIPISIELFFFIRCARRFEQIGLAPRFVRSTRKTRIANEKHLFRCSRGVQGVVHQSSSMPPQRFVFAPTEITVSVRMVERVEQRDVRGEIGRNRFVAGLARIFRGKKG